MAKKIRSDQVDGVVPYTGATQNVNLGDKNLEFTNGSLSRVQNGSRVFNKVYQGYNSGNTTGILSLRVPSIGSAVMFDIVTKFFSYSVKFIGEVRISFYKNGNVIHPNAAKAVISGSSNFPVNSVQVGLDENQNICINLGTIETVWGSHLSFEIERIETKHTNFNVDWSQGWNHIIETVAPDLVANGGKFLSLLNNASFGTELNFGHANKPFLDVINQNLGTAHSPTFNRVNSNDVVTSRLGYFGTYNASQTQGIWSMGTPYGVGATVNAIASSMYGLAYSYIPVGGSSNTASDHEVHFVGVGTPRVSVSLLSGNIRTLGGLIKAGTASSGFWKADGSVDNSTYALASGANASGSWANSSNGLENNPTLPGKTLAGTVTTSLQDANNGTIAGYLNSYGTASGNPDANWWFRLKMLHPNPAGYNGEIALQMTGGNSLRYRKTENGHYGGWIETVDQYNIIAVGGKKMFNTTGNNFNDIPLEAFSDTAASPAIAFHKAGVHAGSIAMINSGLFQFRDLAGTGLVNTQVNISYSQNGFVHNGHNDQDILLTSDGGAIHKKDSILPKVVQTTQNFEYVDIAANPEFREYQVIVWHDAATINIPAASPDIMGMKIVVKLEENTTINNFLPMLEVDGRPWGTLLTNSYESVELVCVGGSWVSTLRVGNTMEIVL